MSGKGNPSAVVRTLVLTDLVSSTHLVETLGDEAAHDVWARHDRLARDLLVEYDGREIDKTDGFLMLFERPLDAVRFALRYHRELARLSGEMGVELKARAGIHLGEVFLRENPPEYVARGAKPLEVEGLAKPTAARVMSLAQGGQTLLTGTAFDLAKRGAVGQEIGEEAEIVWLSHGRYRFKGVAEPLEVFEVGVEGVAPLSPPPATEKARPADDAASIREGTEVNGRYQIIRFLAESADGPTYRAYDRRRESDVTLVQADLSGEKGEERRRRWTGRIAASKRLEHPNILDLYELDETGEFPLLVGQYVEGQTLEQLLAESGRLSNRSLGRILRQLSGALAAAHSEGLIHGNLRLADVLVSRDGFVFVQGIGVRASGQAPAPESLDPDTISPETVKGEPLDQASDVFALGAVAYRLATGSDPFPGDTRHQKIIKRLDESPDPPAQVNPELDPVLDDLITRSLAPRSERLKSVEEFESGVARMLEPAPSPPDSRKPGTTALIAGALVILLLAVALAWAVLWKSSGGDNAAASVPVVAVLPFENRTGNAELDWYGDGLARLVADRLGESRHVRVVSRGRIDALVEEATSDSREFSQLAAAADIEFMLTGEILPASQGVGVAARLVDTTRQEQIASERLSDLSHDALLEAAEPIGLSIRRGLNIPLADDVDVFAADFVTRNPAAYESFVEGMQAWTAFDYDRAEASFAEALEKAPDYQMARFRYASVLAETGRRKEALEEIRNVLKDTSGLTELQAAYVRAAEAWWSGRFDEAIATYREIIDKYPYETEARYSLSIILAYDTRRYEEAVKELKALSQIEPEVHVTWSMLGLAQLQLRDFDAAVESLRRYVELEEGSPNSYELLGDSYRARGDLEKAVGEYRKALEMDPSFASAAIKLAVTEALLGREEEAERRLLPLTSDRRLPPRQRIDAAFELVAIRAAQGRFREAAFFLEALEEPLAEEQVRAAMGFSTRGHALLALGDLEEAGRLIDRAVEESPGVPTRYLFARGMLELKRQEYEQVRATAEKILEGALPPENPDRTEEKAAHYLCGLVALHQGNLEEAIVELRQSVELNGYRYAIYRAGLARALLAAGDLEKALEEARLATQPLDPVEPRLDLEVDRRRALLVLAEVQSALGRTKDAKSTLEEFLKLWKNADPDADALQQARQLSSS